MFNSCYHRDARIIQKLLFISEPTGSKDFLKDFQKISAPKEHDKRIKASHTIKGCGWLFLLCEYYFLCYDVYYIVRIRHSVRGGGREHQP